MKSSFNHASPQPIEVDVESVLEYVTSGEMPRISSFGAKTLDAKTKELITLALDVAYGAASSELESRKSLARSAGATPSEIESTLGLALVVRDRVESTKAVNAITANPSSMVNSGGREDNSAPYSFLAETSDSFWIPG